MNNLSEHSYWPHLHFNGCLKSLSFFLSNPFQNKITEEEIWRGVEWKNHSHYWWHQLTEVSVHNSLRIVRTEVVMNSLQNSTRNRQWKQGLSLTPQWKSGIENLIYAWEKNNNKKFCKTCKLLNNYLCVI